MWCFCFWCLEHRSGRLCFAGPLHASRQCPNEANFLNPSFPRRRESKLSRIAVVWTNGRMSVSRGSSPPVKLSSRRRPGSKFVRTAVVWIDGRMSVSRGSSPSLKLSSRRRPGSKFLRTAVVSKNGRMAKWCCRAARAHPSKLSSRRRPGSKFLGIVSSSLHAITDGGACPAATHFSCCAKKSNEKKATRVRRPSASLRYSRVKAAAELVGRSSACSFAASGASSSNSPRRLPLHSLCCSAARNGDDLHIGYPRLKTANAPPAATNKLPTPRLVQRM